MPRPRIKHLIYDNESHKYCKTCDWWLTLESFHYCCKTWVKVLKEFPELLFKKKLKL